MRPDVVALAKNLRRKRQLSLRQIAAELAAAGHLSSNNKPFTALSIRNMLEG
jgi:hypothetical protein